MKEKTLLITGGSQGIGLAIVQAYAAAGASNIIITARDAERLTKAKQDLEQSYPSTSFHTFTVEIDDTKRTKPLFEKIRTIAEPDVLVLNAGACSPPGPTLENLDSSLLKDFDVNVKGNLSYVAEFLKPDTFNKEKIVINISSFAAQFPVLPYASYGATKLAIAHYLTYVQAEHDDKNVRIVSCHPGVIFTSLTQAAGLKVDAQSWDDGR